MKPNVQTRPTDCRQRLVAMALAAVGLWPLVGFAAYDPSKLPDTTKRWAVNLSLREEYDDNIFTVENDKTGSFKSIVQPQLLVNFPSEQNFVGLRYTYGMTYYENRPGDAIDQQHTADVLFSHTFTPRLTLDMRDSLRRGVEPEIVDLQQGAIPFTLRRRGDFLYNDLNGTVSYDLSRRWTTSVRGDWQRWDYDQSPANNDNRNVYSGTLSFMYALDRRTTAGVNYQYSRIAYDGPATNTSPNSVRSSDSHSGFASLIRRFTPKLSAELDGGVEWRKFGNGDSQASPVVDGSLTYNYAPRSAATAGLRYSLQTTEVSIYRSSDTLSLFGRLNHSFTPKLSAGGGAVLSLSSFENPIPGVVAKSSQAETALRLNANIRYSFTHWCSGEATYTFETVSSDIDGQGFDRNRASLGVRLVY